ncbi:482_t:CDS:1, partial [Dentiscutata erythropus]
ESIIKMKSESSLMEDLIAYPTELSKITSIDTEHERKDKLLSNKSKAQTIQFPMETTPTPPCI